MQYVIGLNGPPKSGKDTIANALRTMMDHECNIPTVIDHLARPMREMALSLTGHDPKNFANYNAIKDSPQKLLKRALGGSEDSIRQLMIRTSEDFIKPLYGDDFWGRKLIDEHKWIEEGIPGVLIVPDIGFPAEVGAFDLLFDKIPQLQTLIVQVERPGVDWGNDSRIVCKGLRNTIKVVNNHEPIYAAGIVLDQMRRLGWALDCEA